VEVIEPDAERGRLEALHVLGVLDRPSDEDLDDLARLAAHCCEAPFALLALVDADRVWIKSNHGAGPRSIR
jgi:phosphoserine phosphatase RsbU/P